MSLQHVLIHGHQIAFRRMGSGPVVVLLHGMAASSATWQRVMPTLAKEFTVVAPDLLGHGESDKPRADYSLGGHASGVRDLMIALGYERATLVGQSFGGGVAMQMAYQYPERCERLVLVGSGGLGAEVSPMLRMLSLPGAEYVLPLGCHRLWRQGLSRLGAGLRRLGWHPGPAWAEVARAYDALSDRSAREALLMTLRSVVDHHGQRVSARDRLYLSSDIPMLIVWGDQDRIIPVQHAVDAHAALPGSRLDIFPSIGHFPHVESPTRFALALSAFVRTTPAAAVSPHRWKELLTSHQPS